MAVNLHEYIAELRERARAIRTIEANRRPNVSAIFDGIADELSDRMQAGAFEDRIQAAGAGDKSMRALAAALKSTPRIEYLRRRGDLQPTEPGEGGSKP